MTAAATGATPARGSAASGSAAHAPAPQAERLFVLDTNVLMHDPTAIFAFGEHDVYLPMVVLEELDDHKKGLSEASRNVREACRLLDELIRDATKEQIDRGLDLPPSRPGDRGRKPPSGKLFFQTRALQTLAPAAPVPEARASAARAPGPRPAGRSRSQSGPGAAPRTLPEGLPGQRTDNVILVETLALQQARPALRVTLVSKDINLRIKAAVLGVHAEDYWSDKSFEDTDVLYSGMAALPADFWERHGEDIRSWKEAERTFYEVKGPLVREWQANEGLYESRERGIEGIVRRLTADSAVLELLRDYRNERHSVWGITARNREQNFALNLLLDPAIDFVTILGPAGTGKTLLALAAGLAQTLDAKRFVEIVMTRVTIPLGEDIGFLPGTEEEKMEPWMGALMDNLEVLTQSGEGGAWGRAATQDLLRSRIKIRSLNFMRGRTFLNRYIILDESQNLTPKQMKALVTRAGPGTKIACLGNVAQIDTPYLSATTSGMTYAVNRFRGWAHSGHVTLTRGERSRLADFASEAL